jgi:formylglycine-generating enzyme required for sulfatase activity
MKAKIKNFFSGLALVAGVSQATAQVTNLGIAPIAGGQSLIYWPIGTMNYVLQTTTNLSSTNWVTATTAVAVNTAAVMNSAPAGFFRLQPVTVPAGMALIPAGWFTMGNSIGDGDITDASPTNVYVSAFVMDINLVSYGFWTNVYAYAMSNGYNFVDSGTNGYFDTGTNYPVSTVDWFDGVKWSNARSQQAGLKPVYYTDAGFTQVFTNGDSGTTVYQNLAADGYRLPTEAEWEKAARGGCTGLRFPWGNLIHTDQAQYSYSSSYDYDSGPANAPFGPSPVGSFDVNGYGLQDMAGNELEWCWDWYGTPYGQPSNINPTGAGSASGFRVARGGLWIRYADYARCADRKYGNPSGAYLAFGFRCVRGL